MSGEDEIVAVEHEPDRGHVRRPIGERGCQLPGAGSLGEEGRDLVVAHLVHGPCNRACRGAIPVLRSDADEYSDGSRPPPSRARSVTPGALAVFGGALLIALAGVGPAMGAPGSNDTPRTVEEALERLESVRDEQVQYESQLESADTGHHEAVSALESASTSRDARVAELAAARRLARLLAVNAYVGGGTDDLSALLDAATNGELVWRQGILTGSADAGQRAAQRYLVLRQQADEAVLAAAADLDARAQQREAAAINVLRSTDAVREAQIWLREAQAAEAEASAAEADAARPTGGSNAVGPPTPGSPPRR